MERLGCVFFQARLPGCSAPCGARPETLSLDSATFEKVDETFILRFAFLFWDSCVSFETAGHRAKVSPLV